MKWSCVAFLPGRKRSTSRTLSQSSVIAACSAPLELAAPMSLVKYFDRFQSGFAHGFDLIVVIIHQIYCPCTVIFQDRLEDCQIALL